MTLGFSTHWGPEMGPLAGMPTYFPDKIMKSMWEYYGKETNFFINNWSKETEEKFELVKPFRDMSAMERERLTPKPHTIRRGHRWKKGDKIHMVINNRTKDRFQFAPVIKCTKVDSVEINHWWYDEEKTTSNFSTVKINGKSLEWKDIEKLSENDGFPSVESFFDFFNEDFEGQIIHWTDLRY